jgi:Ca2+-binding RTX toxin-like protein
MSISETIRFATFNASLNRQNEGDLIADLSTTGDEQAQTVAEIIQRSNPDVLLVNEFDYDNEGLAASLFQQNYLSVSQNGANPIDFPYVYVAPSNTGIPSGFDLNNNGEIGGGDDALGFGFFPGQFGMVLYSKYPIDTANIRTFQTFLWRDMPGALLPDDPDTPAPSDWYSAAELDIFRLSSKSHWDVPIRFNGDIIHALVSHPTPPVFDGPEDRNGTRNHDEIRFWADYVTPGQNGYIYDDAGNFGGLAEGDRFVIMGDQNADPFDGDSTQNAILQLLNNPLINTSITPSSDGGVDAAARQGDANATHQGNPAFDTADFADNTPGNLRADYVLPSTNLEITNAQVFWSPSGQPFFDLVGDFPFPSSDHRLVYTDLRLDEGFTTFAGSAADEAIPGTSAPNSLAGGGGNDLIEGNGGDDTIAGGSGDDTLRGDFGNDFINGELGDDVLIGSAGNDVLVGDLGNDFLAGISIGSANSGRGEVDILIGAYGSSTVGDGVDTFVIADSITNYYDDGDPNSAGLNDYAFIADYSLGIDRLQVNRNTNYLAVEFSTALGSGTGVFVDSDNSLTFSNTDELVALVANVSSADLVADSDRFILV